MSETKTTIIYDGALLKLGRMGVRDLAPALLAVLLFLPHVVLSQTYLGVGAGVGIIDEGFVDDTALTGQLYVGYKLNDYLAFELSYLQTDAFEADVVVIDPITRETSDEIYALAWIPTVHIIQKFNHFSVFASAGLAFWDVRFNDKGAAQNDNDNDLAYGIGFDIQPNRHWAVRGQWLRIEVDGDITGDADFDTLLLGVHRYF